MENKDCSLLICDVQLFPLIDTQSLVDVETDIGESLLTFQQLAKKFSVTVEPVASISSEPVVEKVRQFAPDLILSCRFLHIFRENVIRIPRFVRPFVVVHRHRLYGTLREGHLEHSPWPAAQVPRSEGAVLAVSMCYCRLIPLSLLFAQTALLCALCRLVERRARSRRDAARDRHGY